MSHVHINIDIRNFMKSARALNVDLPSDLVETLDNTLPLPSVQEARAAAAIAVAEAASLPAKERDKKVKEALDAVARAEAGAEIRGRAEDTLARAKWDALTAAMPEVRARFREALAADFKTLNETAPIVADLDPEKNSDNLVPEKYEALFFAKRAAARVDIALDGLTAKPAASVGPLSPSQAMRLRALVIPEDFDRAKYRKLFYGLRGSMPRPGATTLGDKRVTWYGIAGSLGATFDLVEPSESRRNAKALVEALKRTEEEKAKLDAVVL